MNLICPACQWSSSSPPKRVVVTGACPSCSGQVWLEEPVASKVMPGLVAMSFEPGSNLAQRLVAFHRDTSLGGVLQEQEVPKEVAQESRDLLSAAILPAPPVVDQQDASATGVFKLPDMPSLSFEDDDEPGDDDDLIVDISDVHVEVGESSFDLGDSQEVDLDNLVVEVVDGAEDVGGSWLARVPLPDLPDFEESQSGTSSYNDFVEFNLEPVVVNQQPPSWMSAFLMGSLALGLVLCAFSYRTTLANWRVEEVVIPPPNRSQMAQDVWARGISALEQGDPAMAMKLMEEFQNLEDKNVHVFRIMAVAALRQGDRALALRLYRRYVDKLPPESEDAKAIWELLNNAARFVALKDSAEEIEGLSPDWSLVATQLLTHTAE